MTIDPDKEPAAVAAAEEEEKYEKEEKEKEEKEKEEKAKEEKEKEKEEEEKEKEEKKAEDQQKEYTGEREKSENISTHSELLTRFASKKKPTSPYFC